MTKISWRQLVSKSLKVADTSRQAFGTDARQALPILAEELRRLSKKLIEVEGRLVEIKAEPVRSHKHCRQTTNDLLEKNKKLIGGLGQIKKISNYLLSGYEARR